MVERIVMRWMRLPVVAAIVRGITCLEESIPGFQSFGIVDRALKMVGKLKQAVELAVMTLPAVTAGWF